MDDEKKAKRNKTLKTVLLIVLALAVMVMTLPGGQELLGQMFKFVGLRNFTSVADEFPFSVHVINVGKADSILVQCEGQSMLIDGGNLEDGATVCDYLNKRYLTKLDVVVNTHPDKDHIGGLAEVIDTVEVGKYYAPKLSDSLIPDSEEYKLTQEALKKKNLATVQVSGPQTFQLGGATVEILAPLSELDSTNNNSIVIRLIYEDYKFLLMGDAEQEEEEALLKSGADLSANVLKVGHHGSKTSTSEKLLEAVNPEYAVISVGDDSSDLPKTEVLKRLEDAGIKTYRTDVSGTVIFMTNGGTLPVKTQW